MKMISAITTFKTPATGMANNIPSGPINVPPINRTSITAIGWRPTLSPTTSGVIKLLSNKSNIFEDINIIGRMPTLIFIRALFQ